MERIDDLIIFGLGYLNGMVEHVHPKKEMADILGIETIIINRHFSDLRKRGLIEKSVNPESVYSNVLTCAGKEKFKSLAGPILGTFLTPEQHHVSHMVPMRPWLEFIEDRFMAFEIVVRTHLKQEFEVVRSFQRDMILRNDSRYLANLKEGLAIQDNGPPLSVEEMIQACTHLGLKPGEEEIRLNYPNKIWAVLAEGEYQMRSGSIEKAMSLYSHILSIREGLPPNTWIVAYTKYLKCLFWNGDHDGFLRNVDWIEPRIKNPIHKAMILELKAESLSLNKRMDEAASLYTYCLGVFSAMDQPILRTTTMNNAGANYFRQEKFDLAENMWIKARKLARQKGLLWVEAIVCMNMGDNISYHRGQVKRGKDLVRRGRKIMEDLKDLEGIADAYFNEALVCIQEGNGPLADKHFQRSLTFPIHDKVRRNERIEVFKGRLEERGMKYSISFK